MYGREYGNLHKIKTKFWYNGQLDNFSRGIVTRNVRYILHSCADIYTILWAVYDKAYIFQPFFIFFYLCSFVHLSFVILHFFYQKPINKYSPEKQKQNLFRIGKMWMFFALCYDLITSKILINRCYIFQFILK